MVPLLSVHLHCLRARVFLDLPESGPVRNLWILTNFLCTSYTKIMPWIIQCSGERKCYIPTQLRVRGSSSCWRRASWESGSWSAFLSSWWVKQTCRQISGQEYTTRQMNHHDTSRPKLILGLTSRWAYSGSRPPSPRMLAAKRRGAPEIEPRPWHLRGSESSTTQRWVPRLDKCIARARAWN